MLVPELLLGPRCGAAKSSPPPVPPGRATLSSPSSVSSLPSGSLSPSRSLLSVSLNRSSTHHRPEPLEMSRHRPARPHRPDPLRAAPFCHSPTSLHIQAPPPQQVHRVSLCFRFNEQQQLVRHYVDRVNPPPGPRARCLACLRPEPRPGSSAPQPASFSTELGLAHGERPSAPPFFFLLLGQPTDSARMCFSPSTTLAFIQSLQICRKHPHVHAYNI